MISIKKIDLILSYGLARRCPKSVYSTDGNQSTRIYEVDFYSVTFANCVSQCLEMAPRVAERRCGRPSSPVTGQHSSITADTTVLSRADYGFACAPVIISPHISSTATQISFEQSVYEHRSRTGRSPAFIGDGATTTDAPIAFYRSPFSAAAAAAATSARN